MNTRRMLTCLLILSLLFCICSSPALAAKRAKPISEQLAARAVLDTSQTKTIRLGEDGKPRALL